MFKPLTTETANKLHERAAKNYRSVLVTAAKQNGGVANLAAKISVPAAKIHEALDGKGGYIALRNMACEVERKLKNLSAMKHVEAVANRADNPWRDIDADKYLNDLRGTLTEARAVGRLAREVLS